MPTFVEDSENYSVGVLNMFNEFEEFVQKNNYEPIAVMPLKLFKLELIPVSRDSWQEKYNRKTRKWEIPESKSDKNFVETHKETIEKVIGQIKELSELSREEQINALDIIYPPKRKKIPIDIHNSLIDDMINSI
jgi:hypothetical protein